MARVFHPLRVAEIRRETDDTVSLALEVPADLAETFRFAPGQFLTFRVDGPDGKPVQRSYSICSAPGDGELRVVVKRLTGGVFGERAHTTMRVGDALDTLPPLGRFTVPIDASHEKGYLFVAAGSGIAPVMALLRTILAQEPASRCTLVYGNRGSSSVIFAEALNDLKDRYLDRLHVIHIFSRESQATPLLNGRVNADKLRALGKELIHIPSYDEAFSCGPEPMTVEVRDTLIELGIPAEHVHLELYGSHTVRAVHHPGEGDEEAVQLEVVLAGVRRTIPGHRGDTVLDSARAAGLDVPFSCTGGVCATCRAQVVSGSVDMAVNYALQQWELDAGFVLTCQSRPTTGAVTVDYDAV
ncbi:MAG TPA: 2Fe-2S iron-sulfur cluster-binding protein [Mycobacteriales bacterium]|nr:2Fe-2S iron-sulfur cluster-binding protein [Mycobacteriales bacterium]